MNFEVNRQLEDAIAKSDMALMRALSLPAVGDDGRTKSNE